MAAKNKIKFTKNQLILSERYKDKADIINAILIDGQVYTLEETDKLIDGFMKGKVD